MFAYILTRGLATPTKFEMTVEDLDAYYRNMRLESLRLVLVLLAVMTVGVLYYYATRDLLSKLSKVGEGETVPGKEFTLAAVVSFLMGAAVLFDQLVWTSTIEGKGTAAETVYLLWKAICALFCVLRVFYLLAACRAAAALDTCLNENG